MMDEKKFNAWAVAVVYLLENDYAHCDSITDYIIKTNLTTLGAKGKTVSQTIGSMLRRQVVDGQKVFNSRCRGLYSLKDKDSIQKHKEVKSVYECLKNKQPKLNYAELEEENKKLRQENQQLLLFEKLNEAKLNIR